MTGAVLYFALGIVAESPQGECARLLRTSTEDLQRKARPEGERPK